MLSCKSVENQKNQLLHHNIITGADELRESSLAIYILCLNGPFSQFLLRVILINLFKAAELKCQQCRLVAARGRQRSTSPF